jgi:hypothetical protein
MKSLNKRAFAVPNADADAPPAITDVAMVFAEYAIQLVPFALLSWRLWGKREASHVVAIQTRG